MINPKHNPVEWALLVDELGEAHEHLGALISKLGSASEYDEEWFRVDMGHLMAHLNRAWARRNCARSPLPPLRSIEEWAQLREAYWDTVASSDDHRPFNRDLLTNSQVLRLADSIVIWLGIGAAEQLLLAWTVQLLKLIGSQAQIHVVQFTHRGKHNDHAWGVGLLNPDQIKHHPPAAQVRQPLFWSSRAYGRE